MKREPFILFSGGIFCYAKYLPVCKFSYRGLTTPSREHFTCVLSSESSYQLIWSWCNLIASDAFGTDSSVTKLFQTMFHTTGKCVILFMYEIIPQLWRIRRSSSRVELLTGLRFLHCWRILSVKNSSPLASVSK